MKKRCVAFVMAFVMCLQVVCANIPSAYAKQQNYGLDYPCREDTYVEYDCIYFGSYPQSLKAGAKMGSQNISDYNVEPIKWRILTIEDNVALLLSDQILDIVEYGNDPYELTWSNSQIRSWLNGYSAAYNHDGVDYQTQNFINTAFTAAESAAIVPYEYYKYDYLFDCEVITKDKINLLPFDESEYEFYGFTVYNYDNPHGDASRDVAKERVKTDYACSGGKAKIITDGYISDWWSAEGSAFSCMGILEGAQELKDGRKLSGVCPMIRLDLSKTSLWTKADKVTVYEHVGYEYNDKKTVSNPVIGVDGSVKYDCVYFGNYPQSLKDSAVYGSTNESDYNVEPIMWRVLEVKDNKALLVADKAIDVKAFSDYNGSAYSFAWRYSELRSWLNGYGPKQNNLGKNYSKDCFIKKAFNKAERKAIVKTSLKNADNPVYLRESGPDTKDKVFLLSYADTNNKKYGFQKRNNNFVITDREVENDYARIRYNTDYAAYTKTNYKTNYWYLRTSGKDTNFTTFVADKGQLKAYGICPAVKLGICPALTLDLTKTKCWSYAGTAIVSPSESEICPHIYEKVVAPAYVTEGDGAKNYDRLGCSAKVCKLCNHIKSATKYNGRVSIIVGTKKNPQYYYQYTGKNIKPNVVVLDGFGKKLKKGKDYTLVYPKKCKKRGTYKIKIKFKGRFKGTLTTYYYII